MSSSSHPRYRYSEHLHESHAKAQRARELRRNETPPEGILWSKLRNRQIDGLKFRRQHPMGPYVLDFYCEELILAIEVDGEIHARQREHDARRDEWLRSQRIDVVRFSARDVTMNLEGVVTEIQRRAEKLKKEKEKM